MTGDNGNSVVKIQRILHSKVNINLNIDFKTRLSDKFMIFSNGGFWKNLSDICILTEKHFNNYEKICYLVYLKE